MQEKVLHLSELPLLTPRCCIRQFCEKDLPFFIQYRNNADWIKYQGFCGLSLEEYRRELLQQHPLCEGIQLAVADRQTDILLGDLYLRQEGTVCWIGYTIDPAHARQGYTFEAVGALIRFLFEHGIHTIKAGALPQNTASISLLTKLGFAFWGSEEDEVVYCKTNDD